MIATNPGRIATALSYAEVHGDLKTQRDMGVHRNLIAKWRKMYSSGLGRAALLIATMEQRRSSNVHDEKADEMDSVGREIELLLKRRESEFERAKRVDALREGREE
jgi:transposase-like protein